MKKALLILLLCNNFAFAEIPNYMLKNESPFEYLQRGFGFGSAQKQTRGVDIMSDDQFCVGVEQISTSVMKDRQLGVSPSQISAKLGKADIFDVMIEQAFSYPIHPTNTEKLSAAKEFGAKNYLACKHFIKNK